jgi:hypothetical protein
MGYYSGLNPCAQRDMVCGLVAEEHPLIACLQETKLHVISDFDLLQILVTWNSDLWQGSNPHLGTFSASVRLRPAIVRQE